MKLLPVLLISVLCSCCIFNSETDPDIRTTTVGEWEPPMIEVLEDLKVYRPDLADALDAWIEVFSMPSDTEVVVGTLRPLQGFMLAYIHEIDQDDTLTSDEREVLSAIPNVWLEALRNYLGTEQ